jgi:hypothetical protein
MELCSKAAAGNLSGPTNVAIAGDDSYSTVTLLVNAMRRFLIVAPPGPQPLHFWMLKTTTCHIGSTHAQSAPTQA